jgi:hypothetical protein
MDSSPAVPASRPYAPPDTPKRSSLSATAGMAARNLFRHRRRTVVNVVGIGVTVGALLFFQAFYRGSYEQLMFGTIVDYQSAHVLVQSTAFVGEDPDSYCTESTMIPDAASLCDALGTLPDVVASARVSPLPQRSRCSSAAGRWAWAPITSAT